MKVSYVHDSAYEHDARFVYRVLQSYRGSKTKGILAHKLRKDGMLVYLHSRRKFYRLLDYMASRSPPIIHTRKEGQYLRIFRLKTMKYFWPSPQPPPHDADSIIIIREVKTGCYRFALTSQLPLTFDAEIVVV